MAVKFGLNLPGAKEALSFLLCPRKQLALLE
jgi:hypothetical protein